MNEFGAVSYNWILWGCATFLLFAQHPRPPRTALAPVQRFITSMAPVFAMGAAVLFSSLLAAILSKTPPDTSHPLQILLLLATAAGIASIPFLFHPEFIRPLRPHSLAHFMAGLAWASCWPGAMAAAGNGNPTLLLLGAISGLLPNTLDQWAARFLHRTDIHVVPDPLAPDPGMIAGAMATALARCHAHRKPVRIQFYPMEIMANQWQTYNLSLASGNKQILLSLSGLAREGRVPPRPDVLASSPVPLTTDHTATVDIHSDPVSLEMAPTTDGRIMLRVLPWKRQWSHSVTIAIGLGILAWAAWGFYAGLILGGAYALHLLMDQLDFTGSTLFFPFTRHRANGLQMVKPEHATGFYLCVIWLAVLVTGWNWARAVMPADRVPALVPFLIVSGALPLAGMVWLDRRIGHSGRN